MSTSSANQVESPEGELMLLYKIAGDDLIGYSNLIFFLFDMNGLFYHRHLITAMANKCFYPTLQIYYAIF